MKLEYLGLFLMLHTLLKKVSTMICINIYLKYTDYIPHNKIWPDVFYGIKIPFKRKKVKFINQQSKKCKKKM